MEKYVIGIDGGGTGSKGLTANRDGQIIRRFRGGATNYNGSTREEIDNNIQQALEEATSGLKISACQAICIGSAGVSNKAAAAYLEEAVRKAGFHCPVMITADSVTAHAGALNNEEGVILIAGTGAICFGKKQNGETIRVGGYGHLIDDEGSAYDIARRMMRAVVRAEDKRDEPTVLRDLVFRQLQVTSAQELVSWLYDKYRSKREIAYLAMLIGEALKQNDPAALQIVEEAVQGLVDITVPAVEFFEGKTKVALSGSVLKFNPTVRQLYMDKMQKLYPEHFGEAEGVCIQDAEHEADYGAILLAQTLVEKKK